MLRHAWLRLVLPVLVLAMVGLVPVVAADESSAPAPAVEGEAPGPAAEPAPATAPEAGACSGSGLPLEWLPETSCCISRCRRDSDCNAVCAPFGGQCIQVNSCCRECACFG